MTAASPTDQSSSPADGLPVLDLREPIEELAPALDQVCRDIGFFVIVGHGVDSAVIQNAWDATAAFFDLPIDQKMAARHATEEHHPYGYFPSGQEALAASLGITTPPDLKESFNLAPPTDHDDGTGRFGGVDRIWPAAMPELQAAWEQYYEAMVELSERLLILMARALEVEPALFLSAVDRHLSALRGLNYPPLDASALPGQLRAGEHSDYGTLTVLLPGPGTGGLEVRRADDTWVPVQPVDDGFVVNLGDMMQRWTNDRWRSTRHRVAVPDDDVASSERRQSLAFFHQPNWDAPIEAIPTCVADGETPRHEPVLAGPWLASKFDAASTGS